MRNLYENAHQEALHVKAMQLLAMETGKEFAQVREVYEQQLARLLEEAKVRDFLFLITSRHARDALEKLTSAASKGAVSQ